MTYTADPVHGYKAVVSYEGEPVYPPEPEEGYGNAYKKQLRQQPGPPRVYRESPLPNPEYVSVDLQCESEGKIETSKANASKEARFTQPIASLKRLISFYYLHGSLRRVCQSFQATFFGGRRQSSRRGCRNARWHCSRPAIVKNGDG